MTAEDPQDLANTSEPQPAPTLGTRDAAAFYVEIWKQSTQVNQHFNEIGWRIRGLALTVATFTIGAAVVAAREADTVLGISIGTLLVAIGLVLWYAFYFADRVWYHQLLTAAAKHTGQVEEELKKLGLPAAGLGQAISTGSPIAPPKWITLLQFWSKNRGKNLHSTDKLRWFYRIGALALVVVAAGLQIYSATADPPTPSPELVVRVYRG